MSDPEVLERIRHLAVPPAWTDVWICPWPLGHIQAVGTDNAGRRQYRYHDAWQTQRSRQKFERVLNFGRVLPDLRKVVANDLAGSLPSEGRVLAGAVRLLDLGFFRIGGEEYARQHETFGIATLQKRHVRLRHDEMVFDYAAKGSIERTVSVRDPDVFRLLRSLKRRRGGSENLFAHKDGSRWFDVRSTDINSYIREAVGDEFSAKDFRTWSATVLGAVELATASQTPARSASGHRRVVRSAIRVVSEYLGNTPAVCRASYVDPTVIDRFDHGETIVAVLEELGRERDPMGSDVRETIESAVIELIAGEHEQAGAGAGAGTGAAAAA